MTVINSNFLSAVHAFRDNEVLLTGYDINVSPPPGGALRDFLSRILKERPRLHDFLSTMHGFRDNEFLLPTGYDVIVSPPPGSAVRTFS